MELQRENEQGNATSVKLSVVIPTFNEEESLRELYQRLSDVFSKIEGNCEIIFIDDGSTDSSNRIMLELRSYDSRVKLITFRRNQGKSAALAVGFRAAIGDYVVTMDADLQDDPDEIPHLIKAIEEGYDLVSGWKKKRYDPITKTIPSKIFNGVTGMLSGIPLHDFNCGLKIYKQEVAKELPIYGERHRFLPVLAHMHGFKVSEIAVQHHPRKFGRTKFGAYRFIAGFFDLITLLFRMRFLTKPLHLFGSVGMASFVIGIGIIIYLTIGWLQGIWIGNRPLLLIGILGVITGIQLFTLGLLAEMIVEKSQRTKLPIRKDSDILEDKLDDEEFGKQTG